MAPTRESEPRILIVEENEYHGLLMGRQISQRIESSQVVIACSADEALRLARAQVFDLAVVDFVLSDCDGLGLLHSLHQLDPHLAVIVVAEQISERLAREVFKHGCEELLVKDSSYYAVIPRMVAAFLQKRRVDRPQHVRERKPALKTELAHTSFGDIRGEIRHHLNEIFRATEFILNVSGMEDNDLTRKTREIEESARLIGRSLERNTTPDQGQAGDIEPVTVNGDRSAAMAVK